MSNIQHLPEKNLSDDFSFSTPCKLFSFPIEFFLNKVYYNLRLANPFEVVKNNSYSVEINQQLFASDYGLDRKQFMRLFSAMKERNWLKITCVGKQKCNILVPQWKTIIKDIHEAGGHLRPIWSNTAFDVDGKSTKCLTWEMMLKLADITPVAIEERAEVKAKSTNQLFIEAEERLKKSFPNQYTRELWRKQQGGFRNESIDEREINTVTFKTARACLLAEKQGKEILPFELNGLFRISNSLLPLTGEYIQMVCENKEWSSLTAKQQSWYLRKMGSFECIDYCESFVSKNV